MEPKTSTVRTYWSRSLNRAVTIPEGDERRHVDALLEANKKCISVRFPCELHEKAVAAVAERRAVQGRASPNYGLNDLIVEALEQFVGHTRPGGKQG